MIAEESVEYPIILNIHHESQNILKVPEISI